MRSVLTGILRCDTMSAAIVKQRKPGLTGPQLQQLITAHLDEDEFCRFCVQRDINGIALDLWEAHKDDFFSIPEQASLVFICKRLQLKYGKLSDEKKKWLKKIAEKSDLLKNPNPQRGRK